MFLILLLFMVPWSTFVVVLCVVFWYTRKDPGQRYIMGWEDGMDCSWGGNFLCISLWQITVLAIAISAATAVVEVVPNALANLRIAWLWVRNSVLLRPSCPLHHTSAPKLRIVDTQVWNSW